MAGSSSTGANCGQAGPKSMQSRTPAHGLAGCGGRHRSPPTGAAANGMPLYAYTSPLALSTRPRSAPLSVRTSGVRTRGGAGDVAGPAAPAGEGLAAKATARSVRMSADGQAEPHRPPRRLEPDVIDLTDVLMGVALIVGGRHRRTSPWHHPVVARGRSSPTRARTLSRWCRRWTT